MKPFTCNQYSWLQVFMIRTAAKILFFSKTQGFFQKKTHFMNFEEPSQLVNPLSLWANTPASKNGKNALFTSQALTNTLILLIFAS